MLDPFMFPRKLLRPAPQNIIQHPQGRTIMPLSLSDTGDVIFDKDDLGSLTVGQILGTGLLIIEESFWKITKRLVNISYVHIQHAQMKLTDDTKCFCDGQCRIE